MSLIKNYLNLNNLINLTICFLPISFMMGSLVVNLNILTLLILGCWLILFENLKINFNKADYFLISFFFILILSTLINYDLIGQTMVLKGILSLRFLFLYLLFKILFKNNKINLELFFKICLICSSFLSIDVLVQFFYGKDLFGIPPWDGRIAGLFAHEAVAGGYIQRLFLLSFLAIIGISNKIKYKNWLIFSFVFLHLNACFVASNRMSLILLILTVFVLILFFKNLRKILILSVVSLSLSFTFLLNFNDKISLHIKDFQQNIISVETSETSLNANENIFKVKNHFFNSSHGRLYKAVFNSFKNNILIGNGYKSYRMICTEHCSSHPHNFQLEILHNTGVTGYILIFIFTLLFVSKKIIKIIKRNNLKNSLDYVFYFTFLNFLIEIFPLKSTGGLFATWSGTFTWIIISLSLYSTKKLNYKNVQKK
jgi:O-antigen ligase